MIPDQESITGKGSEPPHVAEQRQDHFVPFDGARCRTQYGHLSRPSPLDRALGDVRPLRRSRGLDGAPRRDCVSGVAFHYQWFSRVFEAIFLTFGCSGEAGPHVTFQCQLRPIQ